MRLREPLQDGHARMRDERHRQHERRQAGATTEDDPRTWRTGDDAAALWQSGLQARGTRHEACWTLAVSLWRNNYTPDEAETKLVNWLRRHHNGHSDAVNSGDWKTVKAEVSRQVKWIWTHFRPLPDGPHNADGALTHADVRFCADVFPGDVVVGDGEGVVVIPAHLAFSPDLVPASYWGARGFHFGIHPEHPNLAIMRALRARGTVVSVEPFRAAAQRLSDEELSTLLGSCDIFSPNVEEAISLVGDGAPEILIARLAAAGAPIVALRMGADGSLVYRAGAGTLQHIPAVPVTVVDQLGAGNAYCGGFLVGWLETGDLRQAGRYASVAASFLVEQFGLPRPRPGIRSEAAERLAALP